MFGAVGSTVDTRLRQSLKLNVKHFLREGGLCARTVLCGTQVDHGVFAVGYGTCLVSLMVHVGFKDQLTDGELVSSPCSSLLKQNILFQSVCSQQRAECSLTMASLPFTATSGEKPDHRALAVLFWGLYTGTVSGGADAWDLS